MSIYPTYVIGSAVKLMTDPTVKNKHHVVTLKNGRYRLLCSDQLGVKQYIGFRHAIDCSECVKVLRRQEAKAREALTAESLDESA